MGSFVRVYLWVGVFALSFARAQEVAVYFPDYRYQEGVSLQLYGTTNLILFSATPGEDGSVDFSRIKPGMIALGANGREMNPDLKVTVSVGGWGRGNIFGKAVGTSEARTRFVKNLVEYCEQHSLDGVDIDWEFPKTEKEHSDFSLFLSELSGRLHEKDRILTVALGYTRPLTPEAYAAVDFVNLMSYQPWNPPSISYEAWLEEAVRRMIDSGLPPEKLLVGLPFYIKEMGGERKAISWKKLVGENAVAIPKSDFGYSPAGKGTCDLRVSLIEKYGLGGVMVWDYGHDSPDPEHSLLKHLSEAMDK